MTDAAVTERFHLEMIALGRKMMQAEMVTRGHTGQE